MLSWFPLIRSRENEITRYPRHQPLIVLIWHFCLFPNGILYIIKSHADVPMFLRGKFDRFLFRTIAATTIVGAALGLWGIRNMAYNIHRQENI